MSAWTDLPRPATPGPWRTVGEFHGGGIGIEQAGDDPLLSAVTYAGGSFMPPGTEDAAAIAALPECVAEVDRLRAWVEWFHENCSSPVALADIRAGEWPDGESAVSGPVIPEVAAWAKHRHDTAWPKADRMKDAGDALAARLERCEAALREIANFCSDVLGEPGYHVGRIARDALARPEVGS